ncbi:MAG: hypothetical protein ACJ8MR_19670 [Povalibacter sp.]
MNERSRDPLDVALNSLPRDVQPERDLWADISVQIAQSPDRTDVVSLSDRRAEKASRFTSAPWMRIAAAVLLVVGSSMTTYVITQRSADQKLLQARQTAEAQVRQAPNVAVMPASFGGSEVMGAEYVRARTALDAEFQRQIATLPPVTRAKLERNLADLRRAATEISATLAEHPSHPLLQDLLVSTYQSELELLGSVTHMTVPVLDQTSKEIRL